ncbi:MAG: 1-(5-phosphoribosyl)-5-amino-4-imidazole-carboxylate carboxylase, partial [Alphaproteobacteria bacterium]
MNPKRLRELLGRVADGEVPVDRALDEIKHLPFEDLGFARVDHHRALRVGFPEVIFGEGKTASQIAAIARRLAAAGHNVLVTRIAPGAAAEVAGEIPGSVHDPVARTLTIRVAEEPVATRGTVLVLAAGTTDQPVAEEAVRT